MAKRSNTGVPAAFEDPAAALADAAGATIADDEQPEALSAPAEKPKTTARTQVDPGAELAKAAEAEAERLKSKARAALKTLEADLATVSAERDRRRKLVEEAHAAMTKVPSDLEQAFEARHRELREVNDRYNQLMREVEALQAKLG